MKTIREWLMENSDEVRKVDLQRILGGTTVHVDPKIYSRLKSKFETVLSSMQEEFAREGMSKSDVFRQLVAFIADQISESPDSRTVSAGKVAMGLSGSYGADEPLARETV